MGKQSSEPSLDIGRILKKVRVRPGKRVKLARHDCGWAIGADMLALEEEEIKDRAKTVLKHSVEELADAQELLWASNNRSLLIVFQAMDAAGKDGTIRHVASGLNPAGCEVTSFKAPSAEELDHPFLWRIMKAVPERGKIGIFNRSHYEDVLVVRVHPELLDRSKLARGMRTGDRSTIWKQRYKDINAFERHLADNGTVILKFFLNVSKDEQRRRLLERLDDPSKNWKFNASDLDTRDKWAEYMKAYEEAISATSTSWAPWHIIPADHKWVMRAIVAAIIANSIRSMDMRFPELSAAQRREMAQARKRLLH